MSQTAVPGIELKGIAVDTHYTATGSSSEGYIDAALDTVTPDAILELLGDRDRLVYELEVEAFTESSARIKSRTFVRAKNPFEPKRIKIVNSTLTSSNGTRHTYQIDVGVVK